MLLKVLDKDLIQIGLLSEDVLLLWERKYDKADTFQITAPFKEEYRDLLLEEMFIVKDNDNTIGIIESIEYRVNEKSEEIIIAKGKEASAVLENRFIDGTYKGNDTIPNHIKNIIVENAIEPENKKRVIPGLEFKFDESITSNPFPNRRLQASYGNVLKKVEDLLKEEDLGYKAEYKPVEGKSGKFVFILYKGEDKTYSQEKNMPVIFSRSNDNILTQEYLKSSDEYKNVGLIAGQGEGQDRVKTYVGNIELEGLDRKEVYIDARDIEQDEDMTDEEYLKELKARGKVRLEELEIIETLEGQVNYRSNLEYRKDFDLGDLVVVEDPRWNLVLETRIIEIEEIYEEYFDIRISFGNKIPNLIDEIREIKDKQDEGGGGSGSSIGGGATGEDIENIEIDLEQLKKNIKDLQINKADKKKLEEVIAQLEDFALKDELDDKVGLLDDLKTEEKENIVAAINELAGKEVEQKQEVHTDNEVSEDMYPGEFRKGVTIGNVRLKSQFPTINEWGVVITFINEASGYGQIFITVDGDTWTRRSNSLSSWRSWYSVRREVSKKADKIIDTTTKSEYRIVADNGEFFFEKI